MVGEGEPAQECGSARALTGRKEESRPEPSSCIGPWSPPKRVRQSERTRERVGARGRVFCRRACVHVSVCRAVSSTGTEPCGGWIDRQPMVTPPEDDEGEVRSDGRE